MVLSNTNKYLADNKEVLTQIANLRQLQTELYKWEDSFIDRDLPTPKDLRTNISELGRKIEVLEHKSYELMLLAYCIEFSDK